MQYGIFDFDFENKLINVLFPNTTVSIGDLYDAIKEAQADELGIIYGQIGYGSGKVSLGGDIMVGLTVELLNNWQLKFWSGNYIGRISGGNLVGGISDDPVAYSSGVQVLLIQSAASTIVSVGEGISDSDRTILTEARDEAKKSRKMNTNKAVVSSDRQDVIIYDDDETTILHRFSVTENGLERVPV